MARKKGMGCGALLFAALIALVVYSEKHPESGLDGVAGWAFLLFLVGGVVSIFAKPPKCGVCGQRTGGKMGVAKVNGRRMKACANCVRNIQAKVSRDAVRRIGL